MEPLTLFVLWVAGVTSFTLLGSLYARRYGRIDLLTGLYVAFVLTSQILATKMAVFNLGIGTFIAPAGVLVFSVTFLLTDIINERFGRRETQRVIFIALAAQLAMVFFVWLAGQFQSAPFAIEQDAHWNALFAMIPQVTIGSWVAFMVSENVDAYIYSLFKKLTHGKHLWLRNVISTIPALFLDSIIFISIAFWGQPYPVLVAAMTGQLVLKWIVGLVDVPFMYLNYSILTKGSSAADRVLWKISTSKE